MKAASSGEPAPATGIYELVEGLTGWTGIQHCFEEGETVAASPKGQRWVWIGQFIDQPADRSD